MPDISVTITVPEAFVPRIQAAMNGFFPDLEGGETQRQKFIRLTRQYWIDVETRWRAQQARLGVEPDQNVIDGA